MYYVATMNLSREQSLASLVTVPVGQVSVKPNLTKPKYIGFSISITEFDFKILGTYFIIIGFDFIYCQIIII